MDSISKINKDKHGYSSTTESEFIEIQAANVNVRLIYVTKLSNTSNLFRKLQNCSKQGCSGYNLCKVW